MAENTSQPREYDVVLGNQALPPVGGVVLGGLGGIKQRFPHFCVEQKITSLTEVLKYGDSGLELVIQALQDKSRQVQEHAYALLCERAEPSIQQVLQKYRSTFSADGDCIRLGGLLAVGKWKEADQETTAIMLRMSESATTGLLKLKDIETIPRQVLHTIDQLWLECSQGHFGLSIQKDIWQEIGGSLNADYQTWYQFCNHVGWRANSYWVEYDHLTFCLDAPKGHLPFLEVGGFGVITCLQTLFAQLGNE